MPRSVLVEHYAKNKVNIKNMCIKAKVFDEIDVILENENFFLDSEVKHLEIRNSIFNIIRNRVDVYMVDDFKEMIYLIN